MAFKIVQQKTERVEDNNPDIWVRAAEESLRNNKQSEAIQRINKAVSYSDNNNHYIFEKIKILYGIGHYRECLHLFHYNYEKMRSEFAGDPAKIKQLHSYREKLATYVLERVKQLFRSGNYQECIQLSQKAMDEYRAIVTPRFSWNAKQLKIYIIMCNFGKKQFLEAFKLLFLEPIFLFMLAFISILAGTNVLYETGVRNPEIVKVEIASPQQTLTINKKVPIELDIITKPTNVKNLQVNYTTDNPEILRISADGYMEGIKIGKAKITALVTGSDTRKAEFDIEIVPPNVTKITAEQKNIQLKIGQRELINTNITVDGPVPKDRGVIAVYYVSSNPEVATVDDKGRIKALSIGEADVIIKAGDKQLVLPVKVLRQTYFVSIYLPFDYKYLNQEKRQAIIKELNLKSKDLELLKMEGLYSRFSKSSVKVFLKSNDSNNELYRQDLVKRIQQLNFSYELKVVQEKTISEPRVEIWLGSDYLSNY